LRSVSFTSCFDSSVSNSAPIDPTASAGIAILFLLIVGGVTLYALRHTGAAAPAGSPLTGSEPQIDHGVPPAQVVEMFRIPVEAGGFGARSLPGVFQS
jgi:hypothetical protein